MQSASGRVKCAVLAINNREISTGGVVGHLNSFSNKSANFLKMVATTAISRYLCWFSISHFYRYGCYLVIGYCSYLIYILTFFS